MAAKVNIYWPLASISCDDGGVTEMKVDEGYTSMWIAVEKVLEWHREYGERVISERIDVRGENGRLKYRIDMKD